MLHHPATLAACLLLGLGACTLQQGSLADPTGMRALYEAQCSKGSAFACEQAKVRRGEAAPIANDAPATDLRLNRVGLRETVQIGLNDKASLPFQLAPLAAENTMPIDIYESLRRFRIISDADVIGHTGQAGPDGVALPVVLIRALKAGTRQLTDVPVSVTGTEGQLALGAPFFARFNAWKIDRQRRALHLE